MNTQGSHNTRAPRYEDGYDESRNLIDPNARRVDDLAAAAIDRIENNAEGCPVVGDGEPLLPGHGPLQVSQSSIVGERADIQVFFSTHDTGDRCSIWFIRLVPPSPED